MQSSWDANKNGISLSVKLSEQQWEDDKTERRVYAEDHMTPLLVMS